ncbi:MAG TPA: GAF domain-containing protein [Polyangia bacterium]|jgi:GAF domain-containing protein|nr:GAF domain-containing protein [Polyangia bacterium]HWE26665.1 GAF domain-containing protein [Polyangia bacterium]
MSETMLDVRALPKAEAYEQLKQQLDAILDGVDDEITAMATISCLVQNGFGHLWSGFYRVVAPALLRVGPYQGTLGCLEIAFGRGVCGTAAAEKRTVVVADVEAFPGHISCDGRSKSEIVVPVLDGDGSLVAVFDVDSAQAATFDDDDARGIARLLGWFARRRNRAN